MSAAMCLTSMLLTTALGVQHPLTPVTCVAPEYYWLMPEDFTARGGWYLVWVRMRRLDADPGLLCVFA